MVKSKELMFFYTHSLLSKWGFADGNKLYSFVENITPTPDYPDWIPPEDFLVFADNLLEIVVRKFIMPKLLPRKITLIRICGHNPVRAKTLDGEPVDHYRRYKDPFPVRCIEIEKGTILQEALKLRRNPDYLQQVRKDYPDTGQEKKETKTKDES
ncbi:MAG: hypothetical protein GF308_19575 [Candidatus Heimdallarchaeota archaeon]|nr:hypothetical protein [Candidatus Heimdallarchaeota archaeon]